MRHANCGKGWLARAVGWREFAQFNAQSDLAKMVCQGVEYMAGDSFQKMLGLFSPDLHDDFGHLSVVDRVGQTIGGFGCANRHIDLDVHLEPAQGPSLGIGRAVTSLEADSRQGKRGH